MVLKMEDGMQKMKPIMITAAVVFALASASIANSLEKRHRVGIRAGVWRQTADVRVEVIVGSVTTSVGSSGFMGGVSYGYGLSEGLALNFDVGGYGAGCFNRDGRCWSVY
jgi:hypothetical protein